MTPNPPTYPPPGQPPPGRAPAPTGGSSGAVVVVGALVLVVFGFGAFAVLGGDGDGGSVLAPPAASVETTSPGGVGGDMAVAYGEEPDADGDLPVDVVTQYLGAVASGDCEGMAAAVDDRSEDVVPTCGAGAPPPAGPAAVETIELEAYWGQPDPDEPDMGSGTAVVMADVPDGTGPDREFWLDRSTEGQWEIYAAR